MAQIVHSGAVMAHRIVHEGKIHILSIAKISTDGESVDIHSFTAEEPATRFVNGTVEVRRGSDGKLFFLIP